MPVPEPEPEPQRHVDFMAENVRVFFPFPPYDTQKEYMASVVKALVTKSNALLESPTGTGKTLSLLCSSLAWLQDTTSGTNRSTIYYTSRTHMQLSQAARELKKTAYAKNPAVVIGSRSKMCLNEDVKNQSGDHLINRACRNAIAKNACSYYSNYEQKLEVLNMDNVNDIEDLCSFGRKHQCCPYYASKKIAEVKASVIFMPYNYLLDTSIRKSLQLKLDNSVIIFDEAHNIEGVLKDSVSGIFTESCLSTIQECCLKLPSKIHDALNREMHGLSRSGFDPTEKQSTTSNNRKNPTKEKEPKTNPIEELAEKLTNERLQQVNTSARILKQEMKTHLQLDKANELDKIFDVMKIAGIEYSTSDKIITTLESMASFWSIAGVMSPTLVARYVTAICNLCHFISLLYPEENLSVIRQQEHEKSLSSFYTSFLRGIYDPSPVLKDGKLKDWELNLWCLNPAIGLKRIINSNCILGPRSMIVTSGTLAPMSSIGKELDTEFKIVRDFKHVIEPEQMKILVIGQSPNGYSLASNFDATRKDEYPVALGKTLQPLFKLLPCGTLVFFPSYALMNRVIKYWKERSSIWRDMTAACRSIFIETSEQNSFNADIEAYKRATQTQESNFKAVFFGVFRGKLSEGTNLDGNQCRTVICTGLPFPSVTDPKVIATKKFQERKNKDGGGSVWYSQQMTRALNQTIGRVIRNRHDYGMLILCDPRFAHYKYSMSSWAQPLYPKSATSFENVNSEVRLFFAQHGIDLAKTAAESLGAFDIDFSTKALPVPDFDKLSPFSEESRKSCSQPKSGSQNSNNLSSSSASSDRSLKSLTSSQANNPPPPLSSIDRAPMCSQERQLAMVQSYTVDRATYEEVQNRFRKPGPSESDVAAKKPKTSTVDIFNLACSSEYRPMDSVDSAASAVCLPPSQPKQAPTQTQGQSQDKSSSHSSRRTNSPGRSDGSFNYSVLNQLTVKNKPGEYKCQICLNKAHEPHKTNCKCPRVGCLRCLRVLNKRKCGKCGEVILEKKFDQLLFQTAVGKMKYQPAVQTDVN